MQPCLRFDAEAAEANSMEQVQRLIHLNNRLGEGPVWDAAGHSFYWVNIEGLL